MQKAFLYKIFGQVQGVGFRMWTLRLARHCSITGWVSNLEDGSVCVRAQGTAESLFFFETELSKGSPYSVISEFQKKTVSLEPFSSFEIY